MCGIVGYTGNKQAAPILLSGLAKLEYRGYDSAGVVVRSGENAPEVVKAKGRLRVLEEKTNNGQALMGTCGVGHTRWATHGEPSEVNAHPHCSDDMNVVGVHNGIIENYQELKEKMIRKGYSFYSQTDTEVLIKTVDYYYKKYKMGPIDALAKTMVRVRGSYALAVMFKDYPGQIYAARKDSPMIIGVGEGETYLASDVPAILQYCRSVYYIDNLEMAKLTPEEAVFYNIDGDVIEKPLTEITWDAESAEKGGYEHFMLKEMYEQPKAITDTFSPRIREGKIVIEELGMSEEDIRAVRKIMIVACGSAYHTGMTSKYVFEGLARIPVEVDLASEFRYRDPILEEGTLLIVVSQSGETADTLAALREAKAKGVRVLGIVNVVGSSIAREADNVMYTWAGPEIAVATTKAYSAQLIALYLLAMKFAHVRGQLSDAGLADMIEEMKELPAQVEMMLGNQSRIQKFANRYLAARSIFFIGRGIDYAISLEGSLKLKEVSYIHSEAYAAGELKHGTISLIEEGTLVCAVMTQEDLYKKTLSNMVEVKTRGAFVMAVTNVDNTEAEKSADYVVYIPKTNKYFTNSLAIIPLQLFGYYVAVGRGCDVDKPRNLAKSVTVE